MSKDPIPANAPKPAMHAKDLHEDGVWETINQRPLSPAAKRALDEAHARREARDLTAQTHEKELGGRGGADPARYGDWEIDGRAIDF